MATTAWAWPVSMGRVDRRRSNRVQIAQHTPAYASSRSSVHGAGALAEAGPGSRQPPSEQHRRPGVLPTRPRGCVRLPAFEPSLESRPGESGALDAGGVVDHTFQRREIARLREPFFADHHGLEADYLGLRLLAALAHEPFGHHRGRGLGDGAAPPVELHVGELAARKIGVDGDLVAAEGVEEVLLQVGALELASVAGSLVVLHDHLRVELAHHGFAPLNAPKNSRARTRASTSASTSSSVL